MAVKGTEKVLGGTRATRYPDPPVKGTPNGYGLYPWSAFDAFLVESFKTNGGAQQLVNVGNGQDIGVLVFTSDIPALSRSIVTDSTAGLQYSRIAPNTLGCPFVVTTSGGATAATITNYGQVLTGYAGGALDIFVTGFPLTITITIPGTEGVESTVFLQVVANSPVINGVVGPLFGASALAPSPIILAAALYTQAIKDNGNIYQLNAAAPQYQVVGLYDY